MKRGSKMLEIFEFDIEHREIFPIEIIEKLPEIALIAVDGVRRIISFEFEIAQILFYDPAGVISVCFHLLFTLKCKVKDFLGKGRLGCEKV